MVRLHTQRHHARARACLTACGWMDGRADGWRVQLHGAELLLPRLPRCDAAAWELRLPSVRRHRRSASPHRMLILEWRRASRVPLAWSPRVRVEPAGRGGLAMNIKVPIREVGSREILLVALVQGLERGLGARPGRAADITMRAARHKAPAVRAVPVTLWEL